MAHIGRRWPLAFRRDWAMSCANWNNGFPLQFDFPVSQLLGPVGAALSATVQRLDYVDVIFNSFMLYSQTPFLAGGLHVYTEFNFSIDNAAGGNPVTWFVRKADGTLLFQTQAHVGLGGSAGGYVQVGSPVAQTPGTITASSFAGLQLYFPVPW